MPGLSWQARLLNPYLRLTEKTHLSCAKAPEKLRRSFDLKSRVFFHAPFGTRMDWQTLGPGRALHIAPQGADEGSRVLYFHGGGYVFGNPRTHSAMLGTLVQRTGAVAVLPEYPLAPEAPFPAAVDHALAAYYACLAQGMDPSRLVMGGDSAGGGLALALLALLIADGAPLPAGTFAFSPLTDLGFTGGSMVSNAREDVVLPAHRTSDMAAHYLAGHRVDDPRATPLKADFRGAPDVWLTVGDTEILLDDSRRMAARLKAQRVSVTLEVAHNLPHVWPLFHNLLPEARRTLDMLSIWIKARTSTR